MGRKVDPRLLQCCRVSAGQLTIGMASVNTQSCVQVMSVYDFTFATTICGLHFLSCAIAMRTSSALGFTTHETIPFKHVLLFSIIGSMALATANLR